MKKTRWQLDPTHSELRFKIRHLMIASVSGSFKKFDVQLQTEGEDLSNATISLQASVDSVTTNNEQRDAHLLHNDFFDAEHHPTLDFSSTRIEKQDEENYIVHGNLSLKGITKPVKLNVEYSGLAKDPWGTVRGGFVVDARIDRSEWGVSFNSILETGGVALSNEVRITAEIQMVKVTDAVLA